MNDITVTRADLCEYVHKTIGLSRRESMQIIEDLLDEIIQTLASGEDVKITRFGSFIVRSKKQRMGRNPKTGQEMPITPRRVARFYASQPLKARVNGQDPGADEEEED